MQARIPSFINTNITSNGFSFLFLMDVYDTDLTFQVVAEEVVLPLLLLTTSYLVYRQ